MKYSSEVIWDKANAGMLEGVTKVHTVSTNRFSTGPNTFSVCLQFPQEQWILCWKSIFCKHKAFWGKLEPGSVSGCLWALTYTAPCTRQLWPDPGEPGRPPARTSQLAFCCQQTDFQVSNCASSCSHQFCLLPCRVRNLCCLQRKLVVYWRNSQLYLPRKYQWTSLGWQRQFSPY